MDELIRRKCESFEDVERKLNLTLRPTEPAHLHRLQFRPHDDS